MDQLDPAVGVDIVLGLHHGLGQELALEQPQDAVEEIAPAVVQDVPVFMG